MGSMLVDTSFIRCSSEAYGAKLHYYIVVTLALSLTIASASEFGSTCFLTDESQTLPMLWEGGWEWTRLTGPIVSSWTHPRPLEQRGGGAKGGGLLGRGG